jgi:hypothetical protein
MRSLLIPVVGSLALACSAVADDSAFMEQNASIPMMEFQVTDRISMNLLLSAEPSTGHAFSEKCCKICKTGKACGNSCINRNYQCHQPPGCACDG